MRWFQVRNFFEFWRPMYRACRVFCLATVTSNVIDQTCERTSFDHTLLIVGLLMCGLLFYNTTNAYQSNKVSLTDSNISSFGLFIYLCIFELTVMSALVLNYVNGLKVANFIDIMNRADAQLSTNFGYRWNYQKDHFQAVAYLVFSYMQQMFFTQILTFTSPSFTLFTFFELIRAGVAFGWVMGCYQTLESNTILVLVTIRKRFTIINRQMEEQLTNYLKNPTKVQHPRRRIRQFALMHARLCDSVKLFNACFSMQVVLALGCSFIFTLFAIFGLIHAYAASPDDAITRRVTTGNMFFSGFFLSFVVQLMVCSNRLNYECKRGAFIIHKAVGYGKYDRMIFRECKFVSQQLKHHTPTVSSVLFEFDWTFCYTMVGSLTTHLVILLQFDFANFKMNLKGL